MSLAPQPPRRPAYLFLLAVAALAGCGGDDGPSKEDDEKAVREVVTLSLTTEDHEGDCNRRLSSNLIRKTYGSRARCISVQRGDDEEPADSASFSRVQVDGDAATAAFRIRGGDSDGAAGELELIREDGDWRIHEISVPLLRSLVEAGLETGGDTGLNAGAVDCVARALRELPDAELRSVAYELIGETDEGEQSTFEILGGCPGEGGRSLLVQIFEQGIAESMRESGSSPAEVQCVLRRLRADVTDEQLTAVFTGDDAKNESARLLTPAVRACS